MITYKELANGSVRVFLDGKHVGTIGRISTGYAYYPHGSKSYGEVLPTIAEVKATLEEM